MAPPLPFHVEHRTEDAMPNPELSRAMRRAWKLFVTAMTDGSITDEGHTDLDDAIAEVRFLMQKEDKHVSTTQAVEATKQEARSLGELRDSGLLVQHPDLPVPGGDRSGYRHPHKLGGRGPGK